MSREKSPAFQFYPKDFLADEHVMAMSMAERGAYITLLCVCWLEGSIPHDRAYLTKLLRLHGAVATRVIKNVSRAFTKNGHAHNARLTHARLDLEREKQKTFREMRQALGRQGGLATAKVHQTSSQATDLLVAKRSSSSSSATTYKKPPRTPLERGAGRLTRKDLEHAKDVRARVYGGCPHEPRCLHYDACVGAIALDRQLKAAHAQERES